MPRVAGQATKKTKEKNRGVFYQLSQRGARRDGLHRIDAHVAVERRELGTDVLQTRVDRATHFTGGDIQFRNGLGQIIRAGCRLFYPFGGLGDTPSAEPQCRTFECVRCRSRMSRFGARDPVEHKGDLTGKDLQNLSFKVLIAQRHLSQVALVKGAVRGRLAEIGRPPVIFHDTLSPLALSFFVPRGGIICG